MATVYHNFQPGEFIFSSGNSATPDVLAGTNFPVSVIRFEKGQSSYVYFEAVDYGTGNLDAELIWSADSDDSGDIVLSAQLGAVSPEIDTVAITSETLDVAQSVTDTHLGTTARRTHRTSIDISNLDGLAAGDLCVIKLARDNNVNDTLSGDVFIHQLVITYSNS